MKTMRRIIPSWIFIFSVGCMLLCLLFSSCEDKIENASYIKDNVNINYQLFPVYFEEDDCMVYVDLDGKVIINDDFRHAFLFQNDIAIVSKNNSNEFYYINTKGEQIGSMEYYLADNFYNGYAIVKKQSDDDYIYINRNGEHAIPGEYAKAGIFNNQLAPVKDEANVVIQDYNDQTGSYEYQYDFYYYINKEGEKIIANEDYVEANPFYKNCAVVAIADNIDDYNFDYKYGLINTKGEILVDFDYEDAQDYCTEDLWAVKDDGEWGYVDKNGKEIIDFDYKTAYPFSEGFAAVCEDYNEWYFIDKKGSISNYPYDFENINIGFSEGLAAVKYDNKWGYINTSGDFVIEPQYTDMPTPFMNGYALCEDGIITNKGVLLFGYASPIYEKSANIDSNKNLINHLIFKQ